MVVTLGSRVGLAGIARRLKRQRTERNPGTIMGKSISSIDFISF